MVLRSFAVSDGGSYRLLPGGLTESPGVVGLQEGAVAKDVWVLSSAPCRPRRSRPPSWSAPDELRSGDLAPRRRGHVLAGPLHRAGETSLGW